MFVLGAPVWWPYTLNRSNPPHVPLVFTVQHSPTTRVELERTPAAFSGKQDYTGHQSHCECTRPMVVCVLGLRVLRRCG